MKGGSKGCTVDLNEIVHKEGLASSYLSRQPFAFDTIERDRDSCTRTIPPQQPDIKQTILSAGNARCLHGFYKLYRPSELSIIQRHFRRSYPPEIASEKSAGPNCLRAGACPAGEFLAILFESVAGHRFDPRAVDRHGETFNRDLHEYISPVFPRTRRSPLRRLRHSSEELQHHFGSGLVTRLQTHWCKSMPRLFLGSDSR